MQYGVCIQNQTSFKLVENPLSHSRVMRLTRENGHTET